MTSTVSDEPTVISKPNLFSNENIEGLSKNKEESAGIAIVCIILNVQDDSKGWTYRIKGETI